MCRSSHPDVFCKKGVLRNFANFIGKNIYFHRTPLVAVSIFPRCYVAKQFLEITYFTNILSLEKFSKNLHGNLKLIFLFSTLFVHFKIGYRQSFITVLRISFYYL